MLLHDSIADGKAQTCAFAGGFRREERIVDLFDIFAADSDAGVLHDDFDLRIDRIGHESRSSPPSGIASRAFTNRFKNTCCSLPAFPYVDRTFGSQFTLDTNPRSLELMFQQRNGLCDHLVDIDFRELRRARPRKIQQVVDDLGSAECLLGDLFQQLVPRIFRS